MKVGGGHGLEIVYLQGVFFVMVNGSHTKEISIQKGLKQGNHLTTFLFLLVVEGFSTSLKIFVSVAVFGGFKLVNDML